MNKKAILIFGPPNSGKGTQARLLAEKLGFFQFTTSQIALGYMKESSDPETLKQRELYKQGRLFDPEWTLRVVQEKTREIFQKTKGIVYDGSPRTLYEAEGLHPLLLKFFGRANAAVIKLKIKNSEELFRRSLKRLVCNQNVSHSFIDGADNARAGGDCPECGGVLEKRDLDNEKLFATRMAEYQARTVPAIEFLKEKLPFFEIDGDQPILKVHEDIMNVLSFAV